MHASRRTPSGAAVRGDLPFAASLRKMILIMVVGFAVPVLILLGIVAWISSASQTPSGAQTATTLSAPQGAASKSAHR